MTDFETLGNLSAQELVEKCKQPCGKEVWHEFFVRFTPLLERNINSKLKYSDNDEYLRDPDWVIGEIYQEIVVRLLVHDLLADCEDPTGVNAWLATVARNQAVSWLRRYSRQKNRVRNFTESTLISLSAPVGEDGELTRQDFLAGSSDQLLLQFGPDCGAIWGATTGHDVAETERIYLERLFEHLETLKCSGDPKEVRKYWILRLRLMGQLPLQSEEVDDLSSLGFLPKAEVSTKLAAMHKNLVRTEIRRMGEASRATLYLYELWRLVAQLNEISGDSTVHGAVARAQLEKQIALYRVRRQKLLKKCLTIPRPSNVAMAELVGLPEMQNRQVTVILKRLRKKLYETMQPPP